MIAFADRMDRRQQSHIWETNMRASLGMVRALIVTAVATGVAIASLLTGAVPPSVLANGSGIVGLVTDEYGTPLGGIHVESCAIVDCATSYSTLTSSTVTDGANFHLGPLAPGAYRVTFYDPTLRYALGYLGSSGFTPDLGAFAPVAVTPTTDVRADVRMPLANRLIGTITGRGGIPLAGIDVLPYGPNNCIGPRPGCLRTKTAVDGTFIVGGLSRGTYEVQFTYSDSAPITRWYTTTGDSLDRSAATPITISNSDVVISAALPLDADSCNRPFEPYRGWTLVPYPYRCQNHSNRRVLIGGQELQAVTAGGPGFVALGEREFVSGEPPQAASFTSVDGSIWSARPVDHRVSGLLAEGHGWIVAVGPGTGGRSADGVTWEAATAPPSPTSTVVAVTGDGRGFLAIGQRSATSSRTAVWTSSDGLRWRQVPDQTGFGRFCARAIAGGSNGFVAVGGDCHTPNAASGVVLTSRDGRAWIRAASQSAFSGNTVLTSVVAGGPGFIATGGYRPNGGSWGTAVWTSRSGLSWRRVAYFRTGWAVASKLNYWIVKTTTGFVATGPATKTLISRDGATWTASPGIHPIGVTGRTWDAREAAGGGSTVVVVGSYAQSDGNTLVEYGGLIWTGAPF